MRGGMVADESKQQPKAENLELNKETLQDLTEGDAEQVQGGLAVGLTVAPCPTDPSVYRSYCIRCLKL
jgi:hypothetical protein